MLLPGRHDKEGLRIGPSLEDETENEEELELTSFSISTTSSKEVTTQCTRHNKKMLDNKLEGCSKEIEATDSVDKLVTEDIVTKDKLEATKDKIKSSVSQWK